MGSRGKLLPDKFHLKDIQFVFSGTVLPCEPKHGKWGQLGSSLQKGSLDLN